MPSTDRYQALPTGRPVVIIGAGPGGLCMAIKLLQSGHDNFVILEKAGGVGGTWWHNQYPGAACDVPSHLYSFSFEVKRDWSRPYAAAPEIQAYFQSIAEKYGLAPYIRLNTKVEAAHWNESAHHWQVETATGETFYGDVLIAAQGMFNEPSWPDIPGTEEFKGTLFHSARWNHEHDLTGKRVGVIGSAASAIQFVPEIAPQAGELIMFQRTANWVLPKNDDPYDEATLEHYRTHPTAVLESRAKIWRDLEGFVLFNDPKRLEKSTELGLRAIAQVRDPEMRAKVTPDHPFGCKRPLMADNYYPTFNRDNVQVVTHGVERITPDAVIATDGSRHRVDTLVMATGFDVSRYLASVHVTGRDGRRLDEAWNEGAQAYLGITTAGFPNLFQIYGPNTNNGSILFMIECQVAYIMRQLQRMELEALAWVDVRPEVMAAYNARIQEDASKVRVWWAGCANYYRAPSGRVVTQYPRNTGNYQRLTSLPDPEAFDVHPAA